MIAGIDFGSRYSGNTVVAILGETAQPVFYHTEKKQDADSFLKEIVNRFPTGVIAIDAPLSIPGVYRDQPGCTDYFYRRCDREVQAMSPMFLGGLTARAMRLQDALQTDTRTFFEVYPAAAARQLRLEACGYKNKRRDIVHCVAKLNDISTFHVEPAGVTTWHHFDALLALWVGIRIRSGAAGKVGNPDEGLIYF